jgi:hypothetical protein
MGVDYLNCYLCDEITNDHVDLKHICDVCEGRCCERCSEEMKKLVYPCNGQNCKDIPDYDGTGEVCRCSSVVKTHMSWLEEKTKEGKVVKFYACDDCQRVSDPYYVNEYKVTLFLCKRLFKHSCELVDLVRDCKFDSYEDAEQACKEDMRKKRQKLSNECV